MKIIAVEKLLPAAEENREKFSELLPEQMKHSVKMHLANVVREFYMRTDQPGSVLILEVDDEEQAKSFLNNLPLVKEGLIEFDLIPLGPYLPLALALE
ncbi:MAG: YciI family protein [Desulfovibrio sp.]